MSELPERLQVGDWEVRPREGVILRDDAIVDVRPKAVEVLAYLASKPGEVIGNDELVQEIWHPSVVSDDTVIGVIAELRKAFGDDSKHPQYIARVPKRGYQLIAPVGRSSSASSSAQLRAAFEAVPPPFPAYDGDEPYVFVGYSHSDKADVYPELVRLRESGFNVWYDEGIPAASSWTDEIARAVANCDRFLFFVSPDSATSDSCRAEVEFALNPPRNKPMVVVHLEPTSLPEGLEFLIGGKQALMPYEIDANDYERKLENALRSRSTELTNATQRTYDAAPRRYARVISVVALLVAGVLGAWYLVPDQPPVEEDGLTVAVLDFEAIGDDSELAAFAKGATVDLRGALADTPVDLVDLSQADYVVQAFVRQVDASRQVDVEFKRVRDAKTLWSGDLAESGEVFARSKHIASRIAGMIQILREIQSYGSKSQPARDAFFDGRVQILDHGLGAGGDVNVGQAYIEQALEYDPGFLWALISLADGYIERYSEDIDVHEAIRLGQAIIPSVLKIDEHATGILGVADLVNHWDFAAAIRNFDHQLALRVYEDHASTMEHFKCIGYQARAELDEALVHCNRSIAMGGLVSGALKYRTLFVLGRLRAFKGQHGLAVDAFKQSYLALGQADNTRRPRILISSAMSSFYLGDRAEAQLKLDQALKLDGERYPELFPGILALLDHTEHSKLILEQTEARLPNGSTDWNGAVNTATFWGYYHLGEIDDAFRWIDIGIDNRGIDLLIDLKNSPSPILESLRDDRRFEQAMDRIREVEAEGSPIMSVATSCYHGANAAAPDLDSCARLKE